MAIQCPVCELVNDDMALECTECGRQLMSEAELDETIEPVDGLEHATHAAETALAVDEGQLPDLEQTHFAPAIAFLDERLAVEPTRVEGAAAEILPDPTPDDFETGREEDDGQRTPDPADSAVCPWCKMPSTGKVCDSCGRRRSRYTAEPGAAPAGAWDDGLHSCPNCFGRIDWAPRCSECGIFLPPRET